MKERKNNDNPSLIDEIIESLDKNGNKKWNNKSIRSSSSSIH